MAWVYLVAAVAACTTLAASAPVAQPSQLRLNVTSQARSLGGMDGVTQFLMLSMDDALHETNGVLTERIPGVKWTYFINVLNQPGGWFYNPDLIKIDCVDGLGRDTDNPGCLSKAEVIRRKYAAGHEIALHTYTHLALASGDTIPDLATIHLEIQRNIQYLIDVGVSRSDITGFRAPFLDTASWGPGQVQNVKNNALRMMQEAFNEYGITYDSTFSAPPDKSRPREGVRHCSDTQAGYKYAACSYDERGQFNWPADQGGYPAFTDVTSPEPTWHLFMNTMTWEGKPLSAMDQVHLVCMQLHDQGKVCTVEMVKAIYFENFNKHYDGERNPFGIFLHAGSLIDEVEVDGLNAFLDDVRRLPDVQLATQGEVAKYYRDRVRAGGSNTDRVAAE